MQTSLEGYDSPTPGPKMNFLLLYFVPGWQAQLGSHQKTDMGRILRNSHLEWIKFWNCYWGIQCIAGVVPVKMGWDTCALLETGHKADRCVTVNMDSKWSAKTPIFVRFVYCCTCSNGTASTTQALSEYLSVASEAGREEQHCARGVRAAGEGSGRTCGACVLRPELSTRLAAGRC